MDLVWSRRALHDRQEAIDYIANDNPVAALAQLDAIEHHADRLILHPEMGRPGRIDGTRELVVSKTPYIIVYRLRANRIEIIRLLHGARKWPDQ